jgi:hypothetical protein
MKKSVLLALAVVCPAGVLAQDAQTIDALKQELRELRQRTEQLEEKLKHLEAAPPAAPPISTNAIASTPASTTTSVAPGDAAPSSGFSPSAPLTVFRGGNSYMNISLDGLFAVGGSTANDAQLPFLQPGGHDPIQRGFTVQNVEATFDGAVDPFFRAQANVVFQLDHRSETTVELEEAWAETTSLPWNLTLRAGQLLTDFGRLNSTHPHTWSFVDSPLVNARLLGPDGLRNPGARVSWLAPTPFYSELSLSVQNSGGGTANSFRSDHEGDPFLGRLNNVRGARGPGDMLFAGRYQASWDLSPEQTLLAGVSGATGPNASDAHSDTQIYGVDLFWKWKPQSHNYGFPFVTWQTEAMLRHYRAGAFSEDLNGDGVLDAGDADINGNGVIDSVPRELLKDWGFYSQVAYGFYKGWVTALRFDYVDRLHPGAYELVYGDDSERARRWRISPNLTWYPSEFSKIRLQYNFDEREGIGPDHSIWLQFEFLLGSHGAHKF